MNKPKITIVTVCYNAVGTLERTMLSVLNQTYPNIEYIVIDGASTDGTVDIIKKYADRLAYWVSEPDKGIYDAMNKGIKAATGEWINFMNSGDVFADTGVIDIFLSNSSDLMKYSALYGDSYSVSSKHGQRYNKAKGTSQISKYMPCSHQSIFVKVNCATQLMFKTQYHYAADYDFILRLYKLNPNFKYISIAVSRCITDDGATANNFNKSAREARLIRLSNDVSTYAAWSIYIQEIIGYKLRIGLKRYLPKSWFRHLSSYK